MWQYTNQGSVPGVSDMGWSRVEYNGQTLYCISSYLQTVE